MHIHHCNSTERSGLVWNVHGKMIDAEKGRCLLCKDGENMLRILLKCNERKREERGGENSYASYIIKM
jgi:hypothetical protein